VYGDGFKIVDVMHCHVYNVYINFNCVTSSYYTVYRLDWECKNENSKNQNLKKFAKSKKNWKFETKKLLNMIF
jgi:hypothetical protein